jgi:hypothetical protein
MIGTDNVRLKKLRELALASIDADSMKRVRFFIPTETFAFIQDLEQDGTASQTRSYDVEVKSRASLAHVAAHSDRTQEKTCFEEHVSSLQRFENIDFEKS